MKDDLQIFQDTCFDYSWNWYPSQNPCQKPWFVLDQIFNRIEMDLYQALGGNIGGHDIFSSQSYEFMGPDMLTIWFLLNSWEASKGRLLSQKIKLGFVKNLAIELC